MGGGGRGVHYFEVDKIMGEGNGGRGLHLTITCAPNTLFMANMLRTWLLQKVSLHFHCHKQDHSLLSLDLQILY